MKLFLAAAAALGLGIVAQDPFENASATTELVDGNVYMLTGYGGNIGFSIADDGVLMIDSQFGPMEPKIRAALAELSDEKPKYLVNTHWHGDHTGGNARFSTDAILIAHDNVRLRLMQGGRGKGPAVAEALPILTFNDELSIYFNGEQVQLLHMPSGHTDGDCVVIFHQSKVVHMGDHFFSGMFPFIDPQSGGSLKGYLRNIGVVLENTPKDWKIIPGHGPLSTYQDLVDFRDMIQQTSSIVQQRIASGQSREQVVKAGLPQEWDSWSWSFIPTERWLETLYDELATN